ncbi:MAG: hypothetical protein K1X88_33755 [Nannocystaceae bacterium]|nr:hypothetical protein [Nannocystaceae bacterium]
MLNFSAAKDVDFVPEEAAREWIAQGLGEHYARLGEPAAVPRWFTDSPVGTPRDLDALFELICGVQAEVGQREVEFALVELDASGAGKQLPGFAPLGDPAGQLLHTFVRGDELAMLVVPQLMRVPALVHASVAREIGRIAVHRAGGHQVDAEDAEGDAELAAVALGLGIWVANGAYVYENACCGGGCGLDLKSMRAGLSMPESVFALALDGRRKGLSPRLATKHLEATQKAAFKRNVDHVARAPELLALASASRPALAT